MIGRPELGRVDRDDPGQVVDVVELEMLVHVEPLAERAGEHAAAGGGADDRELLERQVDRPRRHPLAEHHVDPEVFHDRVDELLDGLGQAVDLVDEEDRALRRVGQVGHHVHLLVERRAAGHVQLDAQLVVQHGGERGLAQARGAVEEDVRQRLAPLAGGQKGDRQPLGDGCAGRRSRPAVADGASRRPDRPRAGGGSCELGVLGFGSRSSSSRLPLMIGSLMVVILVMRASRPLRRCVRLTAPCSAGRSLRSCRPRDLNFFLPVESTRSMRLPRLALVVADREQGGVGVADHVGLGVLGRAVGSA